MPAFTSAHMCVIRWYDGPCDDMNEEEELADSVPQVAKCQGGDSRLGKCTLETVRLISCYKLWLEEVRGEGQVKSHPVYVTPIDLGEYIIVAFCDGGLPHCFTLFQYLEMIAFRIIVNTVLHIRVHSNVLYYSISYMYVHVCV